MAMFVFSEFLQTDGAFAAMLDFRIRKRPLPRRVRPAFYGKNIAVMLFKINVRGPRSFFLQNIGLVPFDDIRHVFGKKTFHIIRIMREHRAVADGPDDRNDLHAVFITRLLQLRETDFPFWDPCSVTFYAASEKHAVQLHFSGRPHKLLNIRQLLIVVQ